MAPGVVVVTGASAGVGRATARLFAEKGSDVALISRGRDGLEGTRRDVERFGGRALALSVDVSDAEAVEAAAERIEDELGPIDVWVNNAMTTVFAPLSDTAADEYRRVTEVTYLGCVYGTMSALRRMVPRDRGTVVQVGSALAYRGIPLQSAYCGAKHAIKGFTESVRTELGHERSGVHLTMVQLPALNTPQFSVSRARMPRHPKPVPPIYQPEFAARAVFYAAGARRREVYAGKSTVMTILGNKTVPRIADAYLARTGYDAQMTPDAADTHRPDYLCEPVPGDRGAHGVFDDEAREGDVQFWATRNRLLLAAAAGLGLAGAAALLGRKA